MNIELTATPLQAAIVDYFSGERLEIWLTLGAMTLVSVFAIWLWLGSRTSFASGLAITTVVTSIMLAGGAVSLLTRDAGLSANLLQALGTEHETTAVAAEHERIRIVLSKYPYYRYGAGVLAVLAVLCLALTSRAWLHGLAAGLLLLVVAQTVIDHYSERRAGLYFHLLEKKP